VVFQPATFDDTEGLPSHVEKMEGTLPKKCDSKGKWDNCGLLIPINAHKLP
jgi:hypothetical protein